MTEVVNIKNGNRCDIYIGRSKANFHYGNPFSYNPAWGIECIDRDQSVKAYEQWLLGHKIIVKAGELDWRTVDPKRRSWILDRLPDLAGQKLGCFCAPLACHGDILKRLADNWCCGLGGT